MAAVTGVPWKFYGRRQLLESLRAVLARERWFFVRLSGRRRIGKSSLIRQALGAEGLRKFAYIQVPDADPASVVAAATEHLRGFGIEVAPASLLELARELFRLIRAGYVVVIDEFQYFHRRALFEFTSHLQKEIDEVLYQGGVAPGGLIVLGSIHTEMAALLEERSAPLYGRLNHYFDVPHLEVAALLEILREHADTDPHRLLFLWTLFEGVPKYYRDAYDFGVLGADRHTALRRLFFDSSAPLANEAETWFMKELHGRYDLVLKFIARHPGCTHQEIAAHAQAQDATSRQHVTGFLRVLAERYRMIELLQPVFARPSARSGRYYLKDNFLMSWLSALAIPTAVAKFEPIEDQVAKADEQLMRVEGRGLEHLVRVLYAERSRGGIGDFRLTRAVEGYWDRRDTEIDLVAVHEADRRIRFGTCKRHPERLVKDLTRFEGHVARFLESRHEVRDWEISRVAITVQHTDESRKACERVRCLPQDLRDLTSGL
jgi:hypothetical protein